jgi:AraC-like DNA-binding protein
MGIDVLSDVLSTVRLKSAVFFDVTCLAPWVTEAPEGRLIAPSVLPGVEHLIPYHAVCSGGCWGGVVGEELVRLEAGDIIVLPHGHPHVLSSAPGMRSPTDLSIYVRPPDGQLPVPLTLGEGQDTTRLVCGYLGCDAHPFNPLLDALPPCLVIRDREGWLSRFVDVALTESRQKRAGGQSVLSKISELMFVEVLRRHLEGLGSEQTGWLAGLRDPHTGRALALLHERPKHPWTLDELGHEVGLSRSALAERFTHLVGQPPMQYLSQWRMQIAAGLLSKGAKVVEAAFEVGYDSEAAFSRAFKRLVGMSPALWRDRKPGAEAPLPQ